MKSVLLTLSLFLFLSTGFSKNLVKLHGTIGSFEIQMELETFSDTTYSIQGKYMYKGKTSFLVLKGNLYGKNILELDEFIEGEYNGSFYLETEDQKTWKGKWVGLKKYYDAELTIETGSVSEFERSNIAEMRKTCNGNLTGTYSYETYFLNDLWLHENSMEVGFNGGLVSVEEKSEDSLFIHFEITVGPTYHLAFFEGMVGKTATNTYTFNSPLYDGESACHLIFKFDEKKLTIEQQSPSSDCDFGARAHANGEFLKIKDVPTDSE